jgi:hypothetical protein
MAVAGLRPRAPSKLRTAVSFWLSAAAYMRRLASTDNQALTVCNSWLLLVIRFCMSGDVPISFCLLPKY